MKRVLQLTGWDFQPGATVVFRTHNPHPANGQKGKVLKRAFDKYVVRFPCGIFRIPPNQIERTR